jgi:drug/metabolite transporter (DMT)-like permease
MAPAMASDQDGYMNAILSGRAWALLVALSILWGGSFFFVGVAVREWPPLCIVLARVALAAAILWLVVAWQGTPVRLDAAALRAHLGMGLLNNAVPFSLIVWAQGSLASGVASIFNATTPLFAVLVAHLARTEQATLPRMLGVGLGLAGVAAMAGADPSGTPPLAALAMLVGTASYALAGIWGRRFRQLGIPGLHAAAGQTTVASMLLLPLVLLLESPGPPGAATLGALAGLAVLCTALGYLLYFRLLEMAGPVNLLLVTLLIPVTSFGLGVVFLDESLEARHMIGMAAIAGGLTIIDGRLFRRG